MTSTFLNNLHVLTHGNLKNPMRSVLFLTPSLPMNKLQRRKVPELACSDRTSKDGNHCLKGSREGAVQMLINYV